MYKKEKPRPIDGPGSNGLRGGKKAYSRNVLTGTWMQDWGGQPHYKRGFMTSEFQTELQYAQQSGLTIPPKTFGCGLSMPDTKITFKDTLPSESNTWLTCTGSMSKDLSNRTDVYALPMNDKVKNIIETYRKTWTSDSSALRDLRFQTETRRAGNYLADEFQVDSIRMLPGCPKSLENLRAKLIEKFGILALLALRNEIGNWNDVIPSKNLKESLLMKLNIKLSNVEFLQISSFVSPNILEGHDSVSMPKFYSYIAGRTDGFNESQVASIFFKYSENDTITLDKIKSTLSSKDYPDVVTGILNFLRAYSQNGNTLDMDNFILLHKDLYSCDRHNYYSVVNSIWELN